MLGLKKTLNLEFVRGKPKCTRLYAAIDDIREILYTFSELMRFVTLVLMLVLISRSSLEIDFFISGRLNMAFTFRNIKIFSFIESQK